MRDLLILADNAAELLEYAQEQAKTLKFSHELRNAIYGPEGKASKLFRNEEERGVLQELPQSKQIRELIESLPKAKGVANPDDPSGVVSVRMPKSLHRSLILEAEEEGISLNQLIVTKLAVRLSESVQHN